MLSSHHYLKLNPLGGRNCQRYGFLSKDSVCLSVCGALKGLHTLWSCRTELTDVINR